jgi:hypothetical protein
MEARIIDIRTRGKRRGITKNNIVNYLIGIEHPNTSPFPGRSLLSKISLRCTYCS